MAIITSVTRTVDSNGRVWFNTEVAPGYPDMSAHYAQVSARMSNPSGVVMAPDSELAELAAALRG